MKTKQINQSDLKIKLDLKYEGLPEQERYHKIFKVLLEEIEV